MSRTLNTNEPGIETEESWFIVWPNGESFGTAANEERARAFLADLTRTLSANGVPEEYWPVIKRRRRTITRSPWEEVPSV